MVSQLTQGHVAWTMPAPLWLLNGDPSAFANRLRFQTPTILRFATDSFMDDFLNLLNTEPDRLNEFVAAPETWSSPPHEPDPPSPQKTGLALKLFQAREAAVRRLEARGSLVIGQSRSSSPQKVLKLFQPVHQRFYLVTACLVCRVPGLPDRRIDAGAQERATFVVRLLQPHSNADPFAPDPRDCDEFALVAGAWQPLMIPATLADGEEQHPLSPAAYTEDDQRRRRLLVGLIPVGDRERLLQATQPNPAGAPPLPQPVDARQMLLKTQVIGPLKNLEDLANSAYAAVTAPAPTFGNPPTAQQLQNILGAANNQIQQISWYVLLDLARYLEANLKPLWQEIHNNGNGSGLASELQPIWNTLSQIIYSAPPQPPLTIIQALRQAYDAADGLESATTTYKSPGDVSLWPNFLFPFYKVTLSGVQGLPSLQKDDRASFEALITNAVIAMTPNPPNPFPTRLVAQANANPQKPVWFAIRCILQRPNCGPFIPPLVSEPTVAFQSAAYFDPDAPARPIRIGLPIDTTPAGLRKFDKNTAFVMSDTLHCQVSRMTKAAGGISFVDLVLSVLPFPLKQDLPGGGGSDFPCAPEGGVGIGMICSFSIPIITICALIMLIIFVKLLDIIFFWMPFFQICLPLPGLKAKG